MKKRKTWVLEEIDGLDNLAENHDLSKQERADRKFMFEELDSMGGLEEIKAKQRTMDRDIIEGERNTTYFSVVANQRKPISSLEDNVVILEDNNIMIEHALTFYKTRFRQESRDNISLDEGFWEEDEKVNQEEREALEADFSEEEFREAIFESCSNGPRSLTVSLLYFIRSFGLLLKWTS
jgi:hypothetical protein